MVSAGGRHGGLARALAGANMVMDVLDRAMQAHGGGGISQDFEWAANWANARTLRFADGPDEVHRESIAKLELRKHELKKSAQE